MMKRLWRDNWDAWAWFAVFAGLLVVILWPSSGCVARGAVEAPVTVFNEDSAKVIADAIGERVDKAAAVIVDKADAGFAWVKGVVASILGVGGFAGYHEHRKKRRDDRIARNGGVSGG